MTSHEPAIPTRIGDFVADPGLDTLTGPAGAQHLEPKVMEVLLHLARRRGETVSQEELLAAVWGGRFVVEAVVTRAVSELRKALGDDPKAPRYIQTVARRGYRLIAEVGSVAPVGAAERKSASPGPASLPGAAPVPHLRRSRRRELLFAILLLVVAAVAALRWRTPDDGAMPTVDGVAVTPEAYRLYARAQRALSGGSCVAHQAIDDLERALQIAPTFAEAWEQLGWANYNLVSSCGESGAAYTEAVRAAERALELRPDSTQALALRIGVLVETGRAEEAWSLAEPRAAASPQLGFLAAYAATYRGDLERARELVESVARGDPRFFSREGWTPNALIYLGETERFIELVPEPSTPLLRFYRGYALWRNGHAIEAREELAPGFRERPSDPFARLSEALVAVIDGRHADAGLLLGQLALQRQRLAATDGELTYRVAELLAAAGDGERALAEAERAVAQGFACAPCFSASPGFAGIASEPRLAALVHRAAERGVRASGETEAYVDGG
jgi:DNA-binding winged helix-turn-helix (wHTH) protein